MHEETNSLGAEPLINSAELRKRLGCSRATISRMLQKGCPHVPLLGQPRYRYSEVLAWLKEREGAFSPKKVKESP